jgi:hypothetical protein
VRAIKIDVIKHDVYNVDIQTGIDDIYKQLECETFTVPYAHANGDALYLDDETLVKGPESLIGAFAYKDYPNQPLFGHGLIIGVDENGESQDAQSEIEKIKKNVVFLKDLAFVRDCYDQLSNAPFQIYRI